MDESCTDLLRWQGGEGNGMSKVRVIAGGLVLAAAPLLAAGGGDYIGELCKP
jgi:hypothetical protein